MISNSIPSRVQIFTSLLAVLLVPLSNVQSASAQGWGPAKQLDKATIEARKKKSKEKYTSSRLPTIQAVPFVPNYPGSPKSIKLIRAIKYATLGKGENCMVQTFMVKEQKQQVVDWYNSTLTAYGWKVQAANRLGNQLQGKRLKDGASVHVMVSPTSNHKDGFRSQVQLRYIQLTPITSG